MRALTLLHAAVIAIVLVAFTVQPISAQRTISEAAELFDRLDATIAASVAPKHQHSFLVQIGHARDAALGTVKLPPSPCRAINLLDAFGNHVDAQAGKKISMDGARTIQVVVADLQEILLPPNPCSQR